MHQSTAHGYAMPLHSFKQFYAYPPCVNKLCYSKKVHASLSKTQLKKYCDILGVPINASEAKIKQSFYKRSLVVHPDKNKSPESTKKFSEISEAYQALTKHKKYHQHYDHHLAYRRHGFKDVRPWFQNRQKAPPPPPFTQAQSNVRESKSDNEPASGASLCSVHSQASGWCGDFYRKQLQEDIAAHQQKKLHDRTKPNNYPDCIVM